MVVLSADRSEGLEISTTGENEEQRNLIGMVGQYMYHETGKPVQPAILRVRYSALPGDLGNHRAVPGIGETTVKLSGVLSLGGVYIYPRSPRT